MTNLIEFPPPSDFGGPSKFTTWRAEQLDAIMRFAESTKRFNAFNIPTGGGKSIVAAMVARITDSRTLVLTSTKPLQDQYFERDHLVDADMRGQNNYECLAVKSQGPLRQYGNRDKFKIMVDRAPCQVGVQCWMKFNGCTYFDAIRHANNSQITVANRAYWLSLGRSIAAGRGEEQLGQFDLIVHDEAHNTAKDVCDALRIELDRELLSTLLGLNTPSTHSSIDRWRTWGVQAAFRWADEMDRLKEGLRAEHVDHDFISHWKQMQTIGTALEQVAAISGEWVVADSDRGNVVQFDAVWPTSYSEHLLFRGIKKHIFLSATMTPAVLDLAGVTVAERDYIEYPSPFPLENRPIYIMERAPCVDRKLTEQGEVEWLGLIDAFIADRPNVKGIIHCVSYARMERIKLLSTQNHRFITHGRGNGEVQDAVSRFRNAKSGTVLLSPSITEGEDFPDDQCRFVIIPKLPFEDTSDPVNRRREEISPGYGKLQMMIKLIQSAGRGVRSVTDWCETIIIDGNARWALPSAKEYAPQYFQDAWIWRYTLPTPNRR